MLRIRITKQYKKDYKKAKKQNRNLAELKSVINLIVNQKAIPKNYNDHPLSGMLKGLRDCHIEPDFILLYKVKEDELILVRVGSHSELFK